MGKAKINEKAQVEMEKEVWQVRVERSLDRAKDGTRGQGGVAMK